MLHIIKDIFTRPQVRPLGAALLLATALTACEDQLPTADTSAGNGPTLTLCIDNEEEDPATRTSLDNADPTHHVQAVKILIFKGTGNDATYLDQETLTWSTNGEGRVDRKEYTLQHLFTEEGDYTLLGVGMDDTFGNAYDIVNNNNNSAISAGTTLANAYACLKDGKSPADCEFFTGTVSFTYRKNHNIEVDDLLMRRRVAGVMLYVTDIPQSINDKRTTKITLELCENEKSSVRLQRVFDDLNWTESEQTNTDNKVLATIDLLEQNADGSYKYAYKEGQDCYKTDGKNMTAYAGRYMLPLNAPADGAATLQVKIHGKTISATDTGDGTALEDEETVEKAFKVQNRSEASDNGQPIINFAIRSNYIYCIGKKGEGIDEPMSLGNDAILLEVLPWQELAPTVDFDPARIQAIFDPGFDEDKYIFNCINNTFTVKVLPSLFKDGWKIEIPTETQAYDGYFNKTTYSTADADKGNQNYMTPWLYILLDQNGNPTTYEYDRFKPDMYKGYKVDTEYTRTAEQALNDTEPVEITFVMLDYAVYRPWGWKNHQWTNDATAIERINNDIRTIDVTLVTERNGVQRKDILTIKQYNTITVDFQSNQDNDDKEVAICGFSRVDWGDRFVKFPTESRIVEQDPDNEYDETHIIGIAADKLLDNDYKSSGWGWWNTACTYIYGFGTNLSHRYGSKSNGAENMKRLGEEARNWEDSYPESAPGKCEVLFKRIGDDDALDYDPRDGLNKSTNKCWYLPAQYEMEGIWQASAKSGEQLKINTTTGKTMEGVCWWTSTIDSHTDMVGSDLVYSAIRIRQTYGEDYSDKLTRALRDTGASNANADGTRLDSKYNYYGTAVYMRQARKFTQYYIDNKDSEWVTYPNGQAEEQTNP